MGKFPFRTNTKMLSNNRITTPIPLFKLRFLIRLKLLLWKSNVRIRLMIVPKARIIPKNPIIVKVSGRDFY